LARVTVGTDAERTGLRYLASGALLNLFGAAVSAVAGLLLVIVITRSFPKSDAGVFFSATSLFLIVLAVTKLGTGTGLVYFISRFRALGTPQLVTACLRSAFLPVAAVSFLVAVGAFAFAPQLATVLVPGEHGSLLGTVRMLAVFLPLAALFETCAAATRGFRDMRPTVYIDRLGRPLAQLVLVLLASRTNSVVLLVLAWAGPYLPSALLSWWWLRRLRRPRRRGRHAAAAFRVPHQRQLAEAPGPAERSVGFWRFTAPRTFASIAQMANQRLDIVLVGMLRGPAEAAVYTAATRFLVIGQLGIQSINMAAQPRLAELLAVGDRRQANLTYRTATAWTIAITWPVYLLSALLAPLLLQVFGQGYTEGATVVVVVSCTMLLATACGMVDMVLTMAGRTSWNLVNYLVALALNLILGVLLIPRYGMVGAAIAHASAIAAANVVPLIQVAFALRLHPFSWTGARTILAAVACFGVVPFFLQNVVHAAPALVAVAVGAGVLGYASWLWRLRRQLHLNLLRGGNRVGRAERPPRADPVAVRSR
jgi:O-antigen/teichoic acid export membrane protein